MYFITLFLFFCALFYSSSTSHVGGANRMDWYSSVQHGANLLGPKADIELKGIGKTVTANGYFTCIAVNDEREEDNDEEYEGVAQINEEVTVSIVFTCVYTCTCIICKNCIMMYMYNVHVCITFIPLYMCIHY